MKLRSSLILALFVFAALLNRPVSAQPVLTPSTPADRGPSPTFVLGSPALPLAPGSPGFTNATPTATNLTLTGLATLLTNFQAQVEELLPALTNFNTGFDFFTLGNAAGNGVPGGPATAGTNEPGSNAVNGGLSFAAAATAGPTATNAFGLPAGVATMPQARDTLRAMLVLQSDLERLLPTLAALNGTTTNFAGTNTFLTGTNAVAPGFTPGALMNVFSPGSGTF